jgi:hypothetical protein
MGYSDVYGDKTIASFNSFGAKKTSGLLYPSFIKPTYTSFYPKRSGVPKLLSNEILFKNNFNFSVTLNVISEGYPLFYSATFDSALSSYLTIDSSTGVISGTVPSTVSLDTYTDNTITILNPITNRSITESFSIILVDYYTIPGWTRLTLDDMTTSTNWTSRQGTWTAGSTGTVLSTSGSEQYYQSNTTDATLSTNAAIETTFIYGSGTSSTAETGLVIWGANTTVSTGFVRVLIRKDGVLIWDRFGSGGSNISLGTGALTNGTEYRLRAIREGSSIKLYFNGNLVWTVTPAFNTVSGLYVGVWAAGIGTGANVTFKDVAIWKKN